MLNWKRRSRIWELALNRLIKQRWNIPTPSKRSFFPELRVTHSHNFVCFTSSDHYSVSKKKTDFTIHSSYHTIAISLNHHVRWIRLVELMKLKLIDWHCVQMWSWKRPSKICDWASNPSIEQRWNPPILSRRSFCRAPKVNLVHSHQNSWIASYIR